MNTGDGLHTVACLQSELRARANPYHPTRTENAKNCVLSDSVIMDETYRNIAFPPKIF